MANDSNNGLVIGNAQSGRAGFSTQGQLDYVSLFTTPVTASVGFLSRMSSAGVDPFTIAIGQAIGSKFQMSALGHHRLQTALKNLRCVPSIGEVLWFGFGIDHIIRDLNKTTEGATWLMLSATLAETRSTTLSARVLYELMATFTPADPEVAKKLRPSLQQWEKLVSVSAGCLAATPFGTVVDEMTNLMYNRTGTGDPKYHRRLVGNPSDVARILNSLGALSRDESSNLTITGGCDCGWIAAVAYWFFDIDIIFRDSSGQTVYPMMKSATISKRSLTVIQVSKLSNALQKVGEAYTVSDISKHILSKDESSGTRTLHTRVPWESVLFQTFGKQASILLKLSHDFGTAIGSAARIFLEIVHPQANICDILYLDFSTTPRWYAYGASSYGHGFIHFVTETFPETRTLRHIMEQALRVPLNTALAAYQSAQERLRSVCKCARCHRRLDFNPTESNVLSLPCLPVLCKFVIRLALKLSVTSMPLPLLPSRSGLENQYAVLDQLLDYKDEPSEEQDYRDQPSELVRDLYFETAVSDISTLFIGSSTRYDGLSDRVAFSAHGLCIYVGVLCGLTDKPEEMATINIMPGRIETKNGRAYNELTDTLTYKYPVFDYDASAAIPCKKLPGAARPSKARFEVHGVVEENVSSLTAHFVIQKDSGSSVICAPSLLVKRILSACRPIPCLKESCPPLDISGLSIAKIKGEGKFDNELLKEVGLIGLRIVENDPIARLLALLIVTNIVKSATPDMDPQWPDEEGDDSTSSDSNVSRWSSRDPRWESSLYLSTAIIQRTACLSCTIRNAVELSQGDNVYVICN